MKAVLITVHDIQSARKVDFHFWAEALGDRGYEVLFVTAGQSVLTRLRKKRMVARGEKNTWIKVNDKIRKYVFYPPIHPVNLHNPLLNSISTPLFRRYPALMPQNLTEGMNGADLFIVESGAAVMLVPALRQMFQNAKFIYTVSDRLNTLAFHPVISDAERLALPSFTYIRVPSASMMADYDPALRVEHIPPGIDKKNFDRDYPCPYQNPRNAVSVGDMLFDKDALDMLATHHPKWMFHLFGKGAKGRKHYANVIEHGERPFDEIIPYIKHADIGLALYHDAPDAGYIGQSSLKIRQYAYCGLPIVAPSFASQGQDYLFAYDVENLYSAHRAFEKASAHAGETKIPHDALDWDEVAERMLKALEERI